MFISEALTHCGNGGPTLSGARRLLKTRVTRASLVQNGCPVTMKATSGYSAIRRVAGTIMNGQDESRRRGRTKQQKIAGIRADYPEKEQEQPYRRQERREMDKNENKSRRGGTNGDT